MKKIILLIFFLSSMFIAYAQQVNPTHYVTVNLRVRENESLSSKIITTLPKYTALIISETGKTETINSITAPWIKIISQTGFEGWCFSGYVKPIEDNLAEDIAFSFAKREAGTYLDMNYPDSQNVTSLDLIKSSTGYFIQQLPRRFQGSCHAPEILKLSVENEVVYLREIDVVDSQYVIRNEMILEYDGKTYSNGQNKLKRDGSVINIYYKENVPEKEWLGTWEYRFPYTYAGSLNAPMQERVKRYTSDYLKTFTGQYVYDSHKILLMENDSINEQLVKNADINISYNPNLKSLVAPAHDLLDFYEENNGVGNYELYFVDTVYDVPFDWTDPLP